MLFENMKIWKYENMYVCVTDLPITAENIDKIVCAGRSCWKVEDETFSTLKTKVIVLNVIMENNTSRQHLLC